MKFVKALQAKPNPATSLKALLHQHLAKEHPGRGFATIHASSLTRADPEFCPREYCLHTLTKKKPRPETVSTANEWTWEMGRKAQDSLVGWFVDMGRAVGDWKCLVCGVVTHFQKRPAVCQACGCQKHEALEMRFVSDLSAASCGIDLVLDLGQPKLKIVEIKSIDKDEFAKLVAPLAEHKARTALYMRIVSESGDPAAKWIDTDSAKVLYGVKGYGKKDDGLIDLGVKETFSPFKEFDVQRDDSLTAHEVELSTMVKRFRERTDGLPLGVCPTSFTPRAKRCAVVMECFSGKFPAGMMRPDEPDATEGAG